ncbi:COG5436 Predicted integral membrane protein [Rhabdaerophilaceae bacterium]
MIALLHLVIIVVVAGLVHIGGIFILPRTVHDDAFSVLARIASDQGVTLLPAEAQLKMPLVDPHVAIGVCRYSLAEGPLRIRTGLSDTFMAVVFAREHYGIFASVNDRAATSGALDVVLAMPEQLSRIAGLDDSNEAVEEVRIPAPGPRGIAIIKVLVDRPSGREAAEAIIRAVQCGAEALP